MCSPGDPPPPSSVFWGGRPAVGYTPVLKSCSHGTSDRVWEWGGGCTGRWRRAGGGGGRGRSTGCCPRPLPFVDGGWGRGSCTGPRGEGAERVRGILWDGLGGGGGMGHPKGQPRGPCSATSFSVQARLHPVGHLWGPGALRAATSARRGSGPQGANPGAPLRHSAVVCLRPGDPAPSWPPLGPARSRAYGAHAHENASRQVVDGLRTEVCGQQKQSNDPHNNQHNPTRAFAGVIIGAPMATPSAIPWGMTDPRRRWGIAPPPSPPHTHTCPRNPCPTPCVGPRTASHKTAPLPPLPHRRGRQRPPPSRPASWAGQCHTREGGGGARAICSAPGHWVTRKTAGAVGHGHDHEGPLNAEAPKATPRGRGPSGGLRQPPPKRCCPSSVNGAHTPLPPPPYLGPLRSLRLTHPGGVCSYGGSQDCGRWAHVCGERFSPRSSSMPRVSQETLSTSLVTPRPLHQNNTVHRT